MYYNKEFLKRLDENRTKTVYARIIALQLDESPIETIEGRVTQGSINIDGTSAVRRTCSLTMVAENFDYSAFIWGLNTKFKLEIGLENTIDSTYPKIIWFKQGTYFISSFNISHSINSFNISIQGKDKMCALNGEIGGSLTSSVDFGTVEDIETLPSGEKITKITHLNVKDIIRNVVHLYGGEPLHNIIINDLDMAGLELLEYRYDIPMYLYRDINNDTAYYDNVTLDGNKQCMIETSHTVDENGNIIVSEWYAYIDSAKNRYKYIPDTEPPANTRNLVLNDLKNTELEMLVNPMVGSNNPSIIKIEDNQYYIAKINYGDTAGYRFTELTYPGDLIGAVGEALTSILDKIKTMLGDFEYFYDLDGQFIFQKKQTISTPWSPLSTNESGEQVINFTDEVAYTFSGGELVTTFNNNPSLENLRNDYSVWGERQGISGKALPVHMRYAIDTKPVYYKTLSGDVYTSSTYDWRELIYQMAKDYYNNTNNDDLEVLIAANNLLYYPSGKTGYENYYIDLISFWRELYDPTLTEASKIALEDEKTNTSNAVDAAKALIQNKQTALDEAKTRLEECKQDENIDETTLQECVNRVASAENELRLAEKDLNLKQYDLNKIETQLIRYDNYYYKNNDSYKRWNKVVYEAPQNLNFWFDFLDSDGELSQFSVKNIGCRSKAINDSSVKAIYFRETPDVVFTTDFDKDRNESSSYTYINAGRAGMNTMFSISSQGKSAKQKIDDLLYKHGYCIESATINTIPIYYLEPNVRVHIIDEKTNLDGYYNVSKLSIPLTYNGTMSITATKAAESI